MIDAVVLAQSTLMTTLQNHFNSTQLYCCWRSSQPRAVSSIYCRSAVIPTTVGWVLWTAAMTWYEPDPFSGHYFDKGTALNKTGTWPIATAGTDTQQRQYVNTEQIDW